MKLFENLTEIPDGPGGLWVEQNREEFLIRISISAVEIEIIERI